MSYSCEKCGVAQKGKPQKVVTKTREVEHPYRRKCQRDPHQEELQDDPGGFGTQIVKEENLCARCHQAFRDAMAKMAPPLKARPSKALDMAMIRAVAGF